MVISNPPYVTSSEYKVLQPEVKKEPVIALDGGKDGLDFYRKISDGARKYLRPGGYVLFEMNAAKSFDIRNIIEKNGFIAEKIVKDYSGLDRILIGKLNG